MHRSASLDCRFCLNPGKGGPSIDPVEDYPECDPVDPVEHCPCEDEPDPTIRLRATVFFDGTGNNRINVDIGPGASQDDSYIAGFSNVALLEWAQITPAAELTEHISLYVEGMGTSAGLADDTKGSATGEGPTGIKARVALAIEELMTRIRTAAASRDPIEYVHLDAIGFSRGAAAARHFLHVAVVSTATSIETRLKAESFTVGEVKVKFVGLFDTVAALGKFDYANDTAELGLTAINTAERVVQLAAAEEHRSNFRLTNIASAGRKGTQIFLPGVHSDVGGGYADSVDEIDWQVYDLNFIDVAALMKEHDWLVASGWYQKSQLVVNGTDVEILATRRGILNTYSRIPLHMMAAYARDAGLAFTGAVEGNHPIPPGRIAAVQATLLAAVNNGGCRTPGAWFGKDPADDPAWHRELRNSHLHFSARYGIAEKYGVMYPSFNPTTGQRERIIYPG